MSERLDQIRARLAKVNEVLDRREHLDDDGEEWQDYSQEAPYDLAFVLTEFDRAEAARQRLDAALTAVRPYMLAAQRASHLLDGFGPRTNQPEDAVVIQLEAALAAPPQEPTP